MVSLLALLNEQSLHQSFRNFELGLNNQTLRPDLVYEQIRTVWPALVKRYEELVEATTPS